MSMLGSEIKLASAAAARRQTQHPYAKAGPFQKAGFTRHQDAATPYSFTPANQSSRTHFNTYTHSNINTTLLPTLIHRETNRITHSAVWAGAEVILS